MKMFCGLLKGHAMKITTFAINRMISLTRKARIICFSIALPSLKKRKKILKKYMLMIKIIVKFSAIKQVNAEVMHIIHVI